MLTLPVTLKVPVTTAADDIHKFFLNCFPEKIRLDVSSESSARQRIHLNHQALFSSKDKSKKLKCHLLPFLFGALRVNREWVKFPCQQALSCPDSASEFEKLFISLMCSLLLQSSRKAGVTGITGISRGNRDNFGINFLIFQ